MNTNPPCEFVLASASPRRRDLFAELGLPFDVVTSGFDESSISAADPSVLVAELARCKAEQVGSSIQGRPILAADTVVAWGDRILGKPRDDEDARRTLRSIRGQTVEVVTGVALLLGGNYWGATETSFVWMASFSDGDLEDYLRSGVHRDKAGSLAVQHRDPSLVTSTDGCPSNILGLPMCAVARLLRGAGLESPNDATCCRSERTGRGWGNERR